MNPLKWRRTIAVLALIAFLFVLVPRQTQACGPFFSDAIFVYSKHPDFPLERFAGGQIGVLQTSWARSYYVAAYRSLTGESLSPDEATGIKGLWDDRLTNSWESHDEDWVKAWVAARNQVPGAGSVTEIKAYRNREKPNEYESYLNCQEDAFKNAQATLSERIKKFGADSTAVREWLTAQDVVFSNCGQGKAIPEAARADQDALIRADRAYQIAAANFYAGSLDEATQQFDTIAHDRTSPWHATAAYLAARALLRKGNFAEKEEDGRPALAESEARLKAILNDKSAASSHHSAERLLNLVQLRLHPEEKVHQLAHQIMKKNASSDFKQGVWDYTILLDKIIGDGEDTEPAKKHVMPASLSSDELTDWILTFEDDVENSAAHSFDRWEKTHSLPWMVVAISKASPQQPRVDSLLNAAAQVSHSSPAFPTLAFHTVRLLTESKRLDEARTMVDRILAADRSQLPASAVNLFLSQRLMLSRNLKELLQSSQRVPAGYSDNNDGREIPDEEDPKEAAKPSRPLFDADAANILNKGVPVALLKDAALETILAPHLRQDIAQAAFVRAALLGDHVTANQAGAVLVTIDPSLKPFIDAYQRATTPDARQFATTFMALKSPGLRPYVTTGVTRSTEFKEIDSYRDNYWCAEPPLKYDGEQEETDKAKAKPLALPEFLKATRSVAERQLAALQALGPAPDFFCRTAIDWANKNPTDPRAPEALHLAVRSTRYGCTDEATGRWSKAAFDLLHRRYPNSPFAKATKYWFKG